MAGQVAVACMLLVGAALLGRSFIALTHAERGYDPANLLTASVSDLAGNSSTGTVSGIKIDRTAPSTSASAPSAWVNNDVTVTLSATDLLSGVAATYSSLDGAPAHAGTSVSIASERLLLLSIVKYRASTSGRSRN